MATEKTATCSDAKLQVDSSVVRYLESALYTDFEIECEGHVFKVHKVILASRCKWFERFFAGEWKENTEGRLVVQEVRACLFARLLLFIYLGGYHRFRLAYNSSSQFSNVVDDYQDADKSWILVAKQAIWMYRLGGYYDIEALKTFARDKFLIALAGERSEGDEVGPKNLRHLTDSVSLTEEVAGIYQTITNMVYDLIPQGDDTLRRVMVHTAKMMVRFDRAQASAKFLETLRQIPDLSIDMASVELEDKPRKCCHCGKMILVLEYRCACGNLTGCSQGECNRLRFEKSFCYRCCKFEACKYEALTTDDDIADKLRPKRVRCR